MGQHRPLELAPRWFSCMPFIYDETICGAGSLCRCMSASQGITGSSETNGTGRRECQWSNIGYDERNALGHGFLAQAKMRLGTHPMWMLFLLVVSSNPEFLDSWESPPKSGELNRKSNHLFSPEQRTHLRAWTTPAVGPPTAKVAT